MPVVRIPDEQFDRLKRHAEPLVDGVGDVVGRVLDFYEAFTDSPFSVNETSTRTIWYAIARAFNDLDPIFLANPFPPDRTWAQVKTGRWDVHYEWMLRRDSALIDVALHFESHNHELNTRRLASLTNHIAAVKDGVNFKLLSGPRKDLKGCTELTFQIPYPGGALTKKVVNDSAVLMKKLIDRTWEIVKNV